MTKSSTQIENNSSPIDIQTNILYVGDSLTYLTEATKLDKPFVDVAYLDPPYNTLAKFSYKDTRTTGEWKTFMRERLELLHKIMKADSSVFISIDDNALTMLREVGDEVFSQSNFLGLFITKQAIRSNAKHINTVHEYVVVYAKNRKKVARFKIKRIDDPKTSAMIRKITKEVSLAFKNEGRKVAQNKLKKLNKLLCAKYKITWLRNYTEVDDQGKIFFPKDLSVPGTPAAVEIPELALTLPKLKTRKWSTTKKITDLSKQGLLHFKAGRPYEKHYLEDSFDNVSSILDFYSRQGSKDLNNLGLRDAFDTPKPVELIKYLIRISTADKPSAVVLDFFAGSGTTAQAVVEINHEDGKSHKFQLVQLVEKIKPGSKPYQYCLDNQLNLTIDQLTVKRINTVYEQNKVAEDIKVTMLDGATSQQEVP